MIRRSGFAVLLVVSVTACERPTADSPIDDGRPQPVVTSSTGHRFDRAFIDSAYVKDDILHVAIQYGGGCRTHRFSLISSGTYLESYPVQLPMALAHDAQADPCRAFKWTVERFDLTAVKRAYLASYKQGGPLVLQLREPGDGAKTVSVRYEVK